MEKFEALADLVRTLSKRCEELQEQLDAIKNQHESFAKRFEVE